MQRQIGANASVSADYIHVLGLHFRRAYNANARQPNGTFPLLSSGTVITVGDYGNRIHSDQVQLKFERRMANSFSLRTSYTYMKGVSISRDGRRQSQSRRRLGPCTK